MSEMNDTTLPPAPREKRVPRVLNTGSPTCIAEWLLGTVGKPDEPDFGALAGTVFAGGALWHCGPDCIWRPWAPDRTYRLVVEFDGAEYQTPQGKTYAVQMSPEKARSVHNAIECARANSDFFSKAPHGIAFRNGFLRIASDGGCRLETLTPECRATRMLPFDYEPVPAPESFVAWRAFLQSVWGRGGPNDGPDLESIQLVHQMIGYLLSGSNDQQKAFLLLGPPRSGKGTITKLLQRLFGPDATAFKLAGLDQNFSLEPLLGKALAIDSDVRRGKSVNRDEGKIVERILGITSSDAQDIPRKNRGSVTCALPTRLVMCSNPPFSVRDVGGAMASRIVTLPFRVSYLGAEIFDLEEQLARELPAIVALAMQSMKNFRAVGRFVEPTSAAEMREDIERGQSPLKEFFDEWCALDADSRVGCAQLYQAMRQWAEENGNAAPSAQSFGSALKQLGVRKVRPYDAGLHKVGKRPSFSYQGIRLLESDTAGASSPHRTLQRPASGIATVTQLKGPTS